MPMQPDNMQPGGMQPTNMQPGLGGEIVRRPAGVLAFAQVPSQTLLVRVPSVTMVSATRSVTFTLPADET